LSPPVQVRSPGSQKSTSGAGASLTRPRVTVRHAPSRPPRRRRRGGDALAADALSETAEDAANQFAYSGEVGTTGGQSRGRVRQAVGSAEGAEVESGKRSDRPKLAGALKTCRALGATLIIAKLDRLARNVHFVSGLMESGVEFTAVDFPQGNRLTVHILAAVAEHEAKMISERTKAALAAAKRRGVKLGGDRGARLTAKARQAGWEVRQARANARAADLAPVVADIRASGARSLRAIAAALNERGIRTRAGPASGRPALLPKAGVDVRFADLPAIEGPTGRFMLQQMAAVAELEAGLISSRTKAALAAAKRRGVKLGGDRGARLTAKARQAGWEARSLRAIAAGLNDRSHPARCRRVACDTGCAGAGAAGAPPRATRPSMSDVGNGLHGHWPALALQLLYLKASESMGNHDSKVVDADSVD
jgi:DNA invertase Pin-like site-specific DNA recombinase